MSSITLIKSLLSHKAWANAELFVALGEVDAAILGSDLHLAIRILNHTYVVDSIFRGVLEARPHGHSATNTVETPLFDELRLAINAMDAWLIGYIENLNAESLQERIDFVFTDGDRGSMSREEILVHLTSHGSYHRGMVGRILAAKTGAAPRDILTRFLHQQQPERRQ